MLVNQALVDGNQEMKKCGDIAITGVDTAKEYANLKTGIVGVQVRIMPGTTKLPDQIKFDKRDEPVVEEVTAQPEDSKDKAEPAEKEAAVEEKEKTAKTPKKKAAPKKKATKKVEEKKETPKEGAEE